MNAADPTKGDHIDFYGKSGQITGLSNDGFTCAFNSVAINGETIGIKVAKGHVDLTNAEVPEGEEIIILATTTDVKVSNPNNLDVHAHATSEGNAETMNRTEGEKKSIGVTWDYDNNEDQNELDDVHHHITDEEAQQAASEGKLGTGPIESDFDYEQKVGKAKEERTFSLPESLTVGDGEILDLDYKDGLSWTIADNSVVTMSGTKLIANGVGTTTISANGKSCEVTVTMFHDGEGIENDPYLIQNYKQLINVSECWSSYTFFKVNDGISTIDCFQSRENGYVIKYLNGQLDANNCKFINVEGNLTYYASAYDHNDYKTLEVKNVEAYINASSDSNTGLVYYIYNADSVTFDNVKVHGYIEGYMAAPYIGFYEGRNNKDHTDILTFKDCYSDATLVAKNERACGFVCNFYYGYGKVVINNSEFNGIQYTASGNFSYVHGFNNSNIKIVFDEDAATLATNHTTMEIKANVEYTSNNGSNPKYDKDSTRIIKFINSTAAYELGDKVSIEAANNASYATITLFIGGNTINNGGNFVGPYMTETITSKTNGLFVSESIVYCHCVVNPDGCVETESHFDANTNEYHVHNSYYDANTCGSAFITIAQYDTENKVVGITTIQLPKN